MKRLVPLALVQLALGLQPSLAAELEQVRSEIVRPRTSAILEELLSCIDQQVAISRVRNSSQEDALDLLGQIVERERNQPYSPGLRAALTRIVEVSTQRAAAERARGAHPVDNLVIAAMASKALEEVGATIASSTGAVVIASVAAHSAALPADAGLAAAPMLAAPVLAAPPLATPAQSRQMAEFFATRGDEMLAQKNLSAARKFYAFAVQGGSSRAAYALARSYEPNARSQTAGADMASDLTMARSWYTKAAELGSEKAKARLQTLSMDAAQ